MTKKHLEAFALAIGRQWALKGPKDALATLTVVVPLAKAFNPLFDEEKFRDAVEKHYDSFRKGE